MASRKAIFFDLDGTLALNDQPPSTADTEAICHYRAQGHVMVLCTGRAPSHVYESITDIGFDGVVAGAGTYIQWGGQVLYRRVMDREQVRQMVAYVLEHGDKCALEGEHSLYLVNISLGEWSSNWPTVDSAEAFAPDGALADEPILKFTIVSRDFQRVIDHFSGEYHIINHGGSMEILPVGSSKSDGMRRLLETLGIPREDSISFGDSPNDIDMLQFAGVGVAMGNASPAVQQYADKVTASYRDSGVALALRELLG